MKKFFLLLLSLAFAHTFASAQGNANQTNAQQPRPATTPATQTPALQRQPARAPSGVFDLGEYGVQFSLEPRLVVMMAALDAAGFDPAPGKPPSAFRARVRADQQSLDPELRTRLQRFYESHKLRDSTVTPAEQAARYVSLAFSLGAPPNFDNPPSADDLFEGAAEVLDFAPLLRDFFRRSGIEGHLPAYLAEYRAESDLMRKGTREMVKATLDYLHTRPMTTAIERMSVRTPSVLDKKKAPQARTVLHERERRFLVVADLLAAPGAINLRVIADDYYAVIPAGTDPNSSEVRRAYLRYVIDPLVLRFNRDIALKRTDVQSILDARAKASNSAMPAVFEAVARSLVVATDARMTAQTRLNELSARASSRAATAKESDRATLTKEVQEERAHIDDEMAAQLADAYEHGAALAFYFAEQLREQESSGFDFADALTDVISRVDPAREIARPTEYAAARARVVAAREKAAKEAAERGPVDEHEASRRAELIRQLDEVSRMLQARKYPEAEVRLRALLDDYKGEPRVFFALGQTWSVGAQDAANEETRDARLNNALANYANAIQMADRDNDLALISRAHVARGRILVFLEHKDEALKEFDAAINIGRAGGDAYNDALKEKQKLQP
ncbi:MAG: hypothetical protein QOE33_3061 [Acidobacteriota bacterium]|nr:hypothetical protein [Acidobacteriota bacterium]